MNNYVKILLILALTALCALAGYYAAALIQDVAQRDNAVIPAATSETSGARSGGGSGGSSGQISGKSGGSAKLPDRLPVNRREVSQSEVADNARNGARYDESYDEPYGDESYDDRQYEDRQYGAEKRVNEQYYEEEEPADVPNDDYLTGNAGTDASKSRQVLREPYLGIVSVSKPEYNETKNKYSFTVTVDGIVEEYHLCDSHGNELYSQTTPDFLVDPSYSGKYILYVSNYRAKSTQETVTGCYRMVEKLSKSDLESAFNSGDYQVGDNNSFKTRISSKCVLRVSGLMEGEEAPAAYTEIFNRISMGIWSGVTVSSVGYDARNRVSSISITVNY